MAIETIRYHEGKLTILDQTLLPGSETWIEIRDAAAMAEAIKALRVRGAPLIGVSAAYGLAVEAARIATQGIGEEDFLSQIREAAEMLRSTRPTAVNLFWAIERALGEMREKRTDEAAAASGVAVASGAAAASNAIIVSGATATSAADAAAAANAATAASGAAAMAEALLDTAERMHREDIEINLCMGEHGAALIEDGDRILTHCNAGALATCGHGTALGVIRSAVANGKRVSVYCDETRPLLQGARLSAWEMIREGIETTLLCDNMSASLMREGKIDCVIVGADRIAQNGDTANKIGTYGLALIARAHGVPFYVAAPISTIDPETQTGREIVIEHREPDEVRALYGAPTAPDEVLVYNPAFDVTPAKLIDAIITERGVLIKPFEESIASILHE